MHLVFILLLGFSFVAMPAFGQSPKRDLEGQVEDKYAYGEEAEKETALWRESDLQLPDYPQERELINLQIDNTRNAYKYKIGARGISTGKDGVVRYTLALESRKGSANVVYEGVRCSSREYKTYAYGDSKGQFRAVKKPKWRRIKAGGVMVYRKELLQFYLCDDQGLPRTKEQMLEYIAFPHRQVSNFPK